MADIDKNLVLITFLSRAVRENVTLRIGDSTYLGVAGLKTLSLDTFARLGDGTTIVEVMFEGGSSRSQVNLEPHLLLAACEAVIAANDSENELAGASLRDRYADFSGGMIET
mgnify:FL=1